MATMTLPDSVVIYVRETDTYVYRKDDGSVRGGTASVFSPLVKIQLEPAKLDYGLVHLRFTHNNKYWHKSANDTSIVAVSNKPEEDKSKPSCTLFKATRESHLIYLTHAHTGWGVTLSSDYTSFNVSQGNGTALGFTDADTLVKLPKHVAFKGSNGCFLKSDYYKDYKYLRFLSSDKNEIASGHQVFLMNDGNVRIKSDYYNGFWRNTESWIAADTDDITANNRETLFWPIKIGSNIIALRSKSNSLFCKGLTTDNKYDCLNATEYSLTDETKLEVHELLTERKIRNVRYRMEDSRIYDEKPYVAGTTTITNSANQEASMTVSVTFQDEKSYSFTRGLSITAGVTTTIEADLPFIGGASIQMSLQISGSFEWDTTEKKTTSVTASGTVPVPPRSVAKVDYVATKGTCNVPFSYTQEDYSSTSGEIDRFDQIDGIYDGVSYYNYKFQIADVTSL